MRQPRFQAHGHLARISNRRIGECGDPGWTKSSSYFRSQQSQKRFEVKCTSAFLISFKRNPRISSENLTTAVIYPSHASAKKTSTSVRLARPNCNLSWQLCLLDLPTSTTKSGSSCFLAQTSSILQARSKSYPMSRTTETQKTPKECSKSQLWLAAPRFVLQICLRFMQTCFCQTRSIEFPTFIS